MAKQKYPATMTFEEILHVEKVAGAKADADAIKKHAESSPEKKKTSEG